MAEKNGYDYMEKVIPNISYTVNHSLCTGCGICEGACPSHAIHMEVKEGRFVPQVDSSLCKNDKGCHRCHDICPGLGINLMDQANQLYCDTLQDNLIGNYLKCYTGFSTDTVLREQAASGGMVTQFLIWLLENHKIDGAIVTKFDKDAPLKVQTIVAKTKEELLAAKGSKYAPVSLHNVVPAIKKSDGNRYVVVGLPCHIHGFRKLMAVDKRLKEKIAGLFSLFCSGSQSFYYTEYILKQCGGNVENLKYLAYREGSPTGMVAKGKGFGFFKEYTRYNMPLKGTFYPKRCLLCVDMFGELADINFGDIHVEEVEEAGTGINGVIVRDKNWLSLLYEAERSGALRLNEISAQQMLHKRYMAKAKKTRNASFVLLLKRFKLAAPLYDSQYEAKVNVQTVLRYMVMRTKQFIGNHKALWFLLPKIK